MWCEEDEEGEEEEEEGEEEEEEEEEEEGVASSCVSSCYRFLRMSEDSNRSSTCRRMIKLHQLPLFYTDVRKIKCINRLLCT